MANKMTNVTALTSAIAIVSATEGFDPELVAKLEKIRDSFTNKSSGNRKPTPTQLENAKFKEVILEYMTDGGQFTITDLMKGVESLAELSNQRVSAIVGQMVTVDKTVIREEIKRKAYFSKAVAE